MRPPRLTGQGQAGGFDRLLLDVEQVGRVVGAEMLFGMSDQGGGLVAGDLRDGD